MDLGVARLLFNGQGGPSGRKGAESSNWNMFHAQKDLGPGRFSFMLMNSLEPATFPIPGSPELFQTGEAYQGQPLVDHQHPHDFFMNLSATYRQQLGERPRSGCSWRPWASPRSGRPRSCTAPPRVRTRRRRSATTGRIRRTSPST